MSDNSPISPLTENDKARLFLILESHTKILAIQTNILETQNRQLARLELGMFGDERIKHDGLVKDMEEVKKWISAYKVKIAYAAGIFTAVGFMIEKLWDWITRK